MEKQTSSPVTQRVVRYGSIVSILLAVAGLFPQHALAVSSWSPTLLVNTESFEQLDAGDGSTDIELRFGAVGNNNKLYYNIANSRFQFTKALWVSGDITGTGSLTIKKAISGGTLRVDGNSNLRGNLAASGSLRIQGTTTLEGATTINSTAAINGATTITGNTKVRGNLSGSTLRIDGNADFWSTLSASGSIATRANLTINSDADTNNAVLTFGNQTGNQTITYNNSNQRFDFSKDIKVTGGVRASGNLSGSTLNVDGAVNIHGVTYNFGSTQGGANTFLKNDGSGNLSWGASAVGNSSGGIMSLHPEYPNATYFSSGATVVGTLTYGFDATNRENYYRWTSTKTALNDYWTAVRVKLPKNFDHWEGAAPIVFRYRTLTTSAADNYLNVRLLDTANANVTLAGNSSLVSGSADTWATATITITGGTFTPGGTVTFLIKNASKSSGYADAGSINLNLSTTTP